MTGARRARRRVSPGAAACAVGIALCAAATLKSPVVASANAFGPFVNPQVVNIRGYSTSAMEPFITSDGKYLLFNTSNVAPSVPSLQFASRVNTDMFEYEGEIRGAGVNEAGQLSGTPSMDREGDVYFVSPRSYAETLSTIYAGQFSAGVVTDVHLLAGVSTGFPGLVDFDSDVSLDGETLYVSLGEFSGGSGPTTSSIVMYDKVGEGFVADPNSSTILRAVNEVGELDYAASLSSDDLELFFTAASPAKSVAPAIYQASRASTGQPFGRPERVGAITGFAEAPSISADGTTLYYHELVGGVYEIESVSRAKQPAPAVTRVSPRRGPASGGTTVKIKGTNLTGATAVAFGTIEATQVQVKSATEITAISPIATAGTVDVVVTAAGGPSPPSSADRFKSLPEVSSLSPSTASDGGGASVTVTGAGFAVGASATTFKFASKKATAVYCTSSTSCTMSVPAHAAGTVSVKAIANGVASAKSPAGDQFVYF